MGKTWTATEEEFVQNNYKQMTIAVMARKLKRSSPSVEHKMRSLGLFNPKTTESKQWTEKEVAYMESNYEKRGATYIAKKLRRTKISVKRKAQKMGLSTRGDLLAVGTLSRVCLQTDPRVIERWIEKFDLPHIKVNKEYAVVKLIDPEEFWEWAENHKDLIQWHKYVESSILPEPDWLQSTLKSPQCNNHRNKVSYHEKVAVVSGRLKGKSWEDLSQELNRTVDSVKHIWRQNKDKILNY